MSPVPPSGRFPPAESADREGLVSIGGQLSTDWLLDAYGHGIFPWPILEWETSIAWWSPDPRAILELDRVQVSRRLQRTCRAGRFQVTSDRDFSSVIRGCATAGDRRGATWLDSPMIGAYEALHRAGHAHSVEAWRGGRLAGGVYGVAIGGLFAAESMFHRDRDASKVALVALTSHLARRGYRLFDIQQWSPHLATFGAVEIPRDAYLARLDDALGADVSFGDRLGGGR